MLNPKVILITGSTRGIGAEPVRGFARQGHQVVINFAHSEAGAISMRDEVAAENGADSVMVVKADVARRDEVKAMFDRIITQFGRIDATNIPGYIETEDLVTRYHLDESENRYRFIGAIPMARLGTPSDIFKMANFIINESEYVTGQNFFVNGGYYMG